MGFRAVPRVPALSEKFAELYPLTTTNVHGALPKVAEEDERATGVNCKVIPGKRNPALCRSSPLAESVTERREPSVGGMVVESVMPSNDYSVGRAVDRSAETREQVRRL